MRRFTLITIVALAALLILAAVFQIRAARRPGRFPGPTPSATVSTR